MPQLMPPLPLNNFTLINLIHRPQLIIILIQKDTLKSMPLILHRRRLRIMIHPKLMLVIRTIKTHLDLSRILLITLRIIHRTISTRLIIYASLLAFRECDLVALGYGSWFCAERGREERLVVFLEIFVVGVGDGYVVVEAGAAEDEFLFVACGSS